MRGIPSMTNIAAPSAPPHGSDIYWFYNWDDKIEEQRQLLAWRINEAEVKRLQLKRPLTDSEFLELEQELSHCRYNLEQRLAEQTTVELAQSAARPTVTTAQDLTKEWKALETQKTELDAKRKVMWRAASAGTKTINTDARKDWPTNTVQSRIELLTAYYEVPKTILDKQLSQNRIGHQIATLAGGSCGTAADMYCLEEALATQANLWSQDFNSTLNDSCVPLTNRKSIMDNYRAKRGANRAWINILAKRCSVIPREYTATPKGVSIQASTPGTASGTSIPSLPRTTDCTAPASGRSNNPPHTSQTRSSSSVAQSCPPPAWETVESIMANTALTMQEKAAQIMSVMDPEGTTTAAAQPTTAHCGADLYWKTEMGTPMPVY